MENHYPVQVLESHPAEGSVRFLCTESRQILKQASKLKWKGLMLFCLKALLGIRRSSNFTLHLLCMEWTVIPWRRNNLYVYVQIIPYADLV